MSVGGECFQQWQIVEKTKVRTLEGGSACILQQTCAQRGQEGCQWKEGNIAQAYAGPKETLEGFAANHTAERRVPCTRNIR